MKNKIQILLLIVMTALAACKKEKNDGLTPETQTGANTFSCKINGAIFTPKQDLFGPTPLFAQIDQVNDIKTLVVFANNPDANIKTFNFNINDFKGTGEYPIGTDRITIDCYFNGAAPNQEKADSGKIIITKYDGSIVSGTFEFNVKHNSESFTVSSGRFDLKLN